MNILFISSVQMWGGGEVFLFDIMKGLKARGHNIHLLCRIETELYKSAIENGFNVTAIRIGGDFDPIVIWKTSRLMKKLNTEVICTNMDKDLRFGGLAAKIAGVKGIVPSREIDFPLKNTLRYRFFYNTIASQLIVNSEATKETVLRSAPWLNPFKITVIYKGISAEPYDNLPASNIKQQLNLDEKTKLVSFVGQLDERKGIYYLLEAWKSISHAHADATLLIIGKGAMQHYIEDFIAQNHLHNSVRLLGFRRDVPAILKQSYVLTLPSLWEGFGYVLVEAMAARIPTIATATSSIPEIVIDNETGLLVPPKNSKALAETIHSLLQSPERAAAMGNFGRKRMEELFSLKMMVEKFETVFQKSIA